MIVVKPKSSGPASLEDTVTPNDEGMAAPPETEGEVATEEQKAIIGVTNHSGWINNGYYEVFGEIENTGQKTGRGISLHVLFKDGNFVTLATVDGPADQPVLRPGEKSSFKIILKNKDKSILVGSYVVLPQMTRN